MKKIIRFLIMICLLISSTSIVWAVEPPEHCVIGRRSAMDECMQFRDDCRLDETSSPQYCADFFQFCVGTALLGFDLCRYDWLHTKVIVR